MARALVELRPIAGCGRRVHEESGRAGSATVRAGDDVIAGRGGRARSIRAAAAADGEDRLGGHTAEVGAVGVPALGGVGLIGAGGDGRVGGCQDQVVELARGQRPPDREPGHVRVRHHHRRAGAGIGCEVAGGAGGVAARQPDGAVVRGEPDFVAARHDRERECAAGIRVRVGETDAGVDVDVSKRRPVGLGDRAADVQGDLHLDVDVVNVARPDQQFRAIVPGDVAGSGVGIAAVRVRRTVVAERNEAIVPRQDGDRVGPVGRGVAPGLLGGDADAGQPCPTGAGHGARYVHAERHLDVDPGHVGRGHGDGGAIAVVAATAPIAHIHVSPGVVVE